MKKQLLLFSACIFVSAALILTSCGKDPYCDDVITIPLKDLEKYVPYTGTETLRFLHNSTDTQTFTGQGMERFYVQKGKGSDADCAEDHESVRIRFKNLQNDDEIKMEYQYNTTINTNIFIFYYKNINMGNRVFGTLKEKVQINEHMYDYVGYYSLSTDTQSFLAFRSAYYQGYGGILKIKHPNDTLTIIR